MEQVWYFTLVLLIWMSRYVLKIQLMLPLWRNYTKESQLRWMTFKATVFYPTKIIAMQIVLGILHQLSFQLTEIDLISFILPQFGMHKFITLAFSGGGVRMLITNKNLPRNTWNIFTTMIPAFGSILLSMHWEV
jgi:hypothetical protein